MFSLSSAAFANDWTPYLLAGTLIALLLAYLWYSFAYRPYQYFKRLGIPGPSPLPFIGNLHQAKTYLADINGQLCRKYGDLCGFYLGRTPYLVTSDPEILKEITIKQFDNFSDRTANESVLVVIDKGKRCSGLGAQMGDEWRTSRHALTPSFSARKMKLMEPLVLESVQRLSERLNAVADSGESVNVSEWYKHMTLEVILATAFGRDIKVQGGEAEELYQQAQAVVNGLIRNSGGQFGVFLAIGAGMPWVTKIISMIQPYTKMGQGMAYLINFLKKVIEARRNQNDTARKDLLQLMLDASQVSGSQLEEGHVLINSLGVLAAGHETTSSALSIASYLLAVNPEVQEKLAEEVSNYLQENPDKTLYEATQELEYLDNVIQETLRMYSPGALVLRRCNKDCTVKGIPIKRGSFVVCPIYRVHYREDLWPKPDTFNPDRFDKTQRSTHHPCAHIPFGTGPRQCIGMRLALMETKMTLIEIVRQFRILLAPETKVPLEFTFSVAASPKSPICLCFERRHQD